MRSSTKYVKREMMNRVRSGQIKKIENDYGQTNSEKNQNYSEIDSIKNGKG